ncbi:putative basic amino acid antiporter YfcC [Endozoicomonas sp.]|uniref:putative basic amino acid antiporter YfcC n=1 Tax=Endozoicomonas sp. TaxID=1892382 RepID=UPI00383B6206
MQSTENTTFDAARNTRVKAASKWEMPDTLLLIFFIGILATVLTYIIPSGSFSSETVTYLVDGVEKSRQVINPESFSYALTEAGEKLYGNVQLFAGGGDLGLMNFPFEGLVSGSKWGAAIGVIMFMLLIGGAFGIVTRTGTIDRGIHRLIERTRGSEKLFIPILFFFFSLGGAVFGMGEEAIAFALIIVPLMVRMGYDGVTTVMVTYVATQLGFASSWMNPFSVVIAQGLAGVPVMSGSGFRMVMWAGFTLAGILFTAAYARRIKLQPEASYSYHSDAHFRDADTDNTHTTSWSMGDTLVMLALVAVMVWVVWGVVKYQWYLPEIASQFFTLGVIVGVIGIVFRLNGMTGNDAACAFREGAASMIGPALLVGFAKGVLMILGGDSNDPNTLNTILHNFGSLLSGFPGWLSAWLMFVFQSVFNFFVTSGSGQAALTMPLMAPLADISGVTRQVAVLAFQLGDGFTNLIVPTSAPLMATLGVCRIDWRDWARFVWRFVLLLFVISSILIVGSHLAGFA